LLHQQQQKPKAMKATNNITSNILTNLTIFISIFLIQISIVRAEGNNVYLKKMNLRKNHV